jgi:hypothetical protein
VIGTDRRMSEHPCASHGVPHGQTERRGIVLSLSLSLSLPPAHPPTFSTAYLFQELTLEKRAPVTDFRSFTLFRDYSSGGI